MHTTENPLSKTFYLPPSTISPERSEGMRRLPEEEFFAETLCLTEEPRRKILSEASSYRITCTRRIQFCAGHRIEGHETKCGNLHGHNYVALMEAESPSLDDKGRVIDFGVLKDRLGGWIEENWDHGFLLADSDDTVRAILEQLQHKYFLLPGPPTAEGIAHYLLSVVSPAQLADTGVTVIRVRVWETENCYADARL